MTNVVKNRIMRILAVIAIVCVSMVFAFSINTTKAQTIAVEGFGTQAEAGVNVSDNANEEGIAFYTDIDTSIYGENVQVYTIVTPEANLVDGDITSLRKETSVDLDGWRIKAVKLEGEGAVKTFMATITFDGLSEAQLAKAYATKLVARSYIEQEGEVIYAQDNLTATSIKEVAQANLAEAIVSEAVVTEENVEKWVKYAGITDVKAYYETTSEVQFIDQDLDSATVYAVNGAEFTELGDIQNSKLSNLELAMAGAGEKTQFIIIKDGKAIVTNAIEATQIIDSKEEFVTLFGKQYADANALMDKAEEFLQAGGELSEIFNSDEKIILESQAFRVNIDGYYVLANDVEFDGTEYFYTETGITDEAAIAWKNANPDSMIAQSGLTFATNWGTRTWTGSYKNLNGTFDGAGHTIKGIRFANQSGIFGVVNGTIKDLAIINAKFGTNASNHYAVGHELKGSAENLYVQVTEVGTPYADDKNGVVGNRRAALFQDVQSAKLIKNVVIEYPDINQYYDIDNAKDTWYGGGYISQMGYAPKQANVQNVIAITATKFASGFGAPNYVARTILASNDAELTEINGIDIVEGKTLVALDGLTRYDDYATLRSANADLSSFDNGLWDISTGAPVWAGLVKENVQILVDEEVVEQINFVANEGTTKTFEIVSDLMDIDYTVEIADPTIATYADGVITKVANGGETTLTYSYEIAGETITGSYKIVIEKEYPALGIIIVDNDTTALPELAVDGEITSVKDFETGTEYLVEGAIAFTNDTNEVKSITVIVTTDKGTEYKATIEVYTKIIMTADEFIEIFWQPDYYMIQTHTVTYQGTKYTETFNELVDTDKIVKNGNNVYMDLSEEFKTMLADGATRGADSTSIEAAVVTGAYILGANIENLGSNSSTYCYQYSPKVVVEKNAAASVPASETVVWGSATYDRAGYRLAGANSYLLEQEFTGVFNGNGYTISGFKSLTQGGLFGTLNNATIKNVAITDVITETYKADGVTVSASSASSGVVAYQNIGKDTVIENVYIEIENLPTSTRFGAIYYNNHASGSQVSTIKDVVIVMPTKEWDYTQTFGAGIIGSSAASTAAANPVTENVIAITGTDIALGYGHASVNTRRVWVAENDASFLEAEGKFNTTVVNGTRKVQTGLFRYNTLDDAITAGKTQIGSWVITAEGVVKAN